MLVLLACAVPAVLLGVLAAFLVRLQYQQASATLDRVVRAVVALVAGAATVGLLLWMFRAHWGVADIDRPAARWASDHATSLSTDVLQLVTDLGGTATVVVLAVVVALVDLWRAPSWRIVALLVLVIAGQSAITNLVKHTVDRARPDIDPIGTSSGPSFPSGHSATAAAAFAAFALVLSRGRGHRTRTWLFAAAGAIAGAVAATRVLLGVHWVTDAVAGIALGWAWFACCAISFGGRSMHHRGPVELAARVTNSDDS